MELPPRPGEQRIFPRLGSIGRWDGTPALDRCPFSGHFWHFSLRRT